MPSTADALGTIALYGPDDIHATKLVAAVVTVSGSRERVETRAWFSDVTDVRQDARITAESRTWLASRGVTHTGTADRIIGCPHEEGVDYTAGCCAVPHRSGTSRIAATRSSHVAASTARVTRDSAVIDARQRLSATARILDGSADA